MNERNYWLVVFSPETWKEFKDSNCNTSGFPEKKWKMAQEIKKGDYLLFYIKTISRFVGIYEVISDAYKDSTPIWSNGVYPSRVKVKKVVEVTPETGVPIKELLEKFTFYNPSKGWSFFVRRSPFKCKEQDGKVVVKAIYQAEKNPVFRPITQTKKRKEKNDNVINVKSEINIVDSPIISDAQHIINTPLKNNVENEISHDEIQYILLKLGSDLGYNVYVARNDKSKDYNGNVFSRIPRFITDLPYMNVSEYAQRKIKLIDVLWLKGKSIISAFEIECTTSIYSGLVRMGNLIAEHNNLNIDLYIVAPDNRRERVFDEINSPLFSQLNPPLSNICRYIPFNNLITQIKNAEKYGFIKSLNSDFIKNLSESCKK